MSKNKKQANVEIKTTILSLVAFFSLHATEFEVEVKKKGQNRFQVNIIGHFSFLIGFCLEDPRWI